MTSKHICTLATDPGRFFRWYSGQQLFLPLFLVVLAFGPLMGNTAEIERVSGFRW